MVPKLLITGFGHFPSAPVNPTATLVERLVKAARRRGIRCVGHVFATEYKIVDRELPALIKRHRPNAILMFGLAARRRTLCIEMCARNRTSTRSPDAGGYVPARAVIASGARARMVGRAPLARLLAAARASGIKSRLSRDAGTYLCNYLYWRALEHAAKPRGPQIAVFVHVPSVRARSRQPGDRRTSLTIDQLVRAGNAVLSAVVAACADGSPMKE
jgi:pyroglutamyl-peptidase